MEAARFSSAACGRARSLLFRSYNQAKCRGVASERCHCGGENAKCTVLSFPYRVAALCERGNDVSAIDLARYSIYKWNIQAEEHPNSFLKFTFKYTVNSFRYLKITIELIAALGQPEAIESDVCNIFVFQ